jgi:putative flippase GtrA
LNQSLTSKCINYIKNNYILITRHLVISGIGAIIDLILFAYLYEVKALSLFIAFFISISITTIIGYLGHTFFTFKTKFNFKSNFHLFIIQITLSLVLGYMVIFFLIEIINFNSFLSKIIQMTFTFIFNFNFGKFLTFRKTENLK